jgi:hypothetical protein
VTASSGRPARPSCSTVARRAVPAAGVGRLHVHPRFHHLVDDKIHARSTGPYYDHAAAAGW